MTFLARGLLVGGKPRIEANFSGQTVYKDLPKELLSRSPTLHSLFRYVQIAAGPER